MRYVMRSPQILNSFLNSVFIAGIGTSLSLLVTSTMGYALSKKNIKIRYVLLPAVVVTLLFKPGIIPTYMVVRGVGLLDTRWALMVPVLINPFYLIIMMKFFEGLPRDVEESAIMDGAGTGTVFARIVVPLSTSGLAVIVLFYAVERWNDFFLGVIYINDRMKYPLQVLLRDIISAGGERIQAASTVFAALPIIIVYPFLQKYFVRGVLLGSIKG